MQFDLTLFCLSLLGFCLFISVNSVPTVPIQDVSTGGLKSVDERSLATRKSTNSGPGKDGTDAVLPRASAFLTRKSETSKSLRSRSHGPGGDSDSDCAVTRRRSRVRRALRNRSKGPGGDSGDSDSNHDSDSHCTDDSDSDDGVIATRSHGGGKAVLPRITASTARMSRRSKTTPLRQRSHGPGGDSGSDSDRCTDDSDDGTLARKSKKSRRSQGPGGDSDHDSHDSDSDCPGTNTTRRIRRRSEKRTPLPYNIELDLV